MDAYDLLKAIGEVKDSYILEAKEPRRKRYLLPVFAACFALIFMLAAVWQLAPVTIPDETQPPHGGSYTEDSVMDIFAVEDTFYSVTQAGKLFRQSENGNEPVKEFPTKDLFWSETGNAFLYYHAGQIVSWDPSTDRTAILAEGLPQPEKGKYAYLVAQVGENILLWVANTVYRYHLPTGEIALDDIELSHSLAYNDKYYLYQKDQNIMCMDCATGEKRQVVALEPLQFVTDACIDGDTLFFVLDSGLHSAALTKTADDGGDRFLPLRAHRNILTIAIAGENMVCVTRTAVFFSNGESQGQLTKVMLCTQDELITLREPGEPLCVNPGACRLAANEQSYCYGICGDTAVIFGKCGENE